MSYCINCGTEIVENAKFCQKCGHPIGNSSDSSTRKQEFSGKMYKCPSCGEALKAFEINCPACGHELRGTKASSAVREFALKLEAIESKRDYEKPSGLFAYSEAQIRLSKTDEQKISLIKSFAVPNSKEDMLEFMILATSSMNMSVFDVSRTNVSKTEKELNLAWLSKVQQVYEKAKRSYSTEDVFKEINELYNKCNREIKVAKLKGIVKWIIMLGWIPIGIIVIIISSLNEPKREAAELERLESIVIDVQTALENKEYKHALRTADSIDYQRYDIEMERKWDLRKEYWIEKVIEEAARNGVKLEYVPSSDIDKANDEPKKADTSGGFVEGFKDGVQPGIDSFNEAIDEFNQTIDEIKETYGEETEE